MYVVLNKKSNHTQQDVKLFQDNITRVSSRRNAFCFEPFDAIKTHFNSFSRGSEFPNLLYTIISDESLIATGC